MPRINLLPWREAERKERKQQFTVALVLAALAAVVIAVLVGIPAGVVAGVKRGSAFDHLLMGVSLTGYSMPIFWWALLLIIFFSGTLHWTPVSGRIEILYFFPPVTGFMLIDSLLSGQEGAFTSALRHLILPAVVLGTIPMAVIARQTRSAMLEVLNEDYVRTARAKGLRWRRVVVVHTLRNSLIPVVTALGDIGYSAAIPYLDRLAVSQNHTPAVRNAAPPDILVPDAFSCREQIPQNTPRQALHFAEVLRPAEPASQKTLSC